VNVESMSDHGMFLLCVRSVILSLAPAALSSLHPGVYLDEN